MKTHAGCVDLDLTAMRASMLADGHISRAITCDCGQVRLGHYSLEWPRGVVLGSGPVDGPHGTARARPAPEDGA